MSASEMFIYIYEIFVKAILVVRNNEFYLFTLKMRINSLRK